MLLGNASYALRPLAGGACRPSRPVTHGMELTHAHFKGRPFGEGALLGFKQAPPGYTWSFP
jgi:hypothetical protein